MCRSILLVACALIALCKAAGPPVTKCKSDDAKCAKDSAIAFLPIFAAGIPELGVETLDPVVFTQINASSNNLKFVLSDVTVTGLKNCQTKKIQRDVPKSKLFAKFLCDAILEGEYELGGQVLVLAIKGKGKLRAALKKALISLDLDMTEKNGADGNPHWHIKSWAHTYELKDKSDIYFGNLFEGNQVLASAAEELIKTNGNDIVHEIGKPVIKTVVARVIKNINAFFHASQIGDLSID